MPSPGHHEDGAERIALLLRVSSEEQRDRETIEIQREFLQEYCRLYDLEVAQIYADDGVSGTIPLHERPDGRRLLADAQDGKFTTLLVYRLDRLGRSLLVIVDAAERLEAEGVTLRSATEPIDTSTPSGRLIFQMLASFAEYERETIRERTRAGAAKQAEKDRYVRAYAQGDISEGELAVYVADLKNQTDNLKLLLASVEAELSQRQQRTALADTTHAWLLSLRRSLTEVEEDTPEAFTSASSSSGCSWSLSCLPRGRRTAGPSSR